jgi:hypothetical protein
MAPKKPVLGRPRPMDRDIEMSAAIRLELLFFSFDDFQPGRLAAFSFKGLLLLFFETHLM